VGTKPQPLEDKHRRLKVAGLIVVLAAILLGVGTYWRKTSRMSLLSQATLAWLKYENTLPLEPRLMSNIQSTANGLFVATDSNSLQGNRGVIGVYKFSNGEWYKVASLQSGEASLFTGEPAGLNSIRTVSLLGTQWPSYMITTTPNSTCSVVIGRQSKFGWSVVNFSVPKIPGLYGSQASMSWISNGSLQTVKGREDVVSMINNDTPDAASGTYYRVLFRYSNNLQMFVPVGRPTPKD
jgi:hypothetical protein